MRAAFLTFYPPLLFPKWLSRRERRSYVMSSLKNERGVQPEGARTKASHGTLSVPVMLV